MHRPTRNVVKTTLVMAALAVILLAVIPMCLSQAERLLGWRDWRREAKGWEIVGALCFGAGAALGIVSGYVLAAAGDGTPLPTDCTRRLVVRGPYRHTRNPFAIGGLLMGLGVGLWLGSPLTLAYVLWGAWFWNRRARPWEEADLERRFGEPFRRYRDAVPCWRMRLRAYESHETPPSRA